MTKSVKLTVLTAGLLLAALTSNANANYVRDGDFNHPHGGSSFTTYGAGEASSSFGPWRVISGNVDLIGGYWQEPGAGQGSVDLDGYTPGAIEEHIRGLTSGTYQLTFSLSGNPQGGNPLKTLEVSIGNVHDDVITYNTSTNGTTTSNMQYETETIDFTITGGHHRNQSNLIFASLDNAGSDAGPVIGNVSINRLSAVPLPAGLPMFAASLLAMVGFHSFRKRQQLA